MRKKAMKKKFPNGRGEAYKVLRSKNFIEEINDKRGNPICLNIMKRTILLKPYVNLEYQTEVFRRMREAWKKQQENQNQGKE